MATGIVLLYLVSQLFKAPHFVMLFLFKLSLNFSYQLLFCCLFFFHFSLKFSHFIDFLFTSRHGFIHFLCLYDLGRRTTFLLMLHDSLLDLINYDSILFVKWYIFSNRFCFSHEFWILSCLKLFEILRIQSRGIIRLPLLLLSLVLWFFVDLMLWIPLMFLIVCHINNVLNCDIWFWFWSRRTTFFFRWFFFDIIFFVCWFLLFFFLITDLAAAHANKYYQNCYY